jgi:probable F420-dependent oxidoreductase
VRWSVEGGVGDGSELPGYQLVSPGAEGLRRGVIFPQGSIGGDPDLVREFVAGVEQAGFDHLVVPDHVLGVDPSAHPGWSGVYDVDDMFHEPMVLFGFLAGVCSLELVTGVLVLPQRQSVLVAKQAAEVDLLTRGRFRLGVGIGWNRVEYQGMSAEFATRGRRIEEQVAVMRRLWTEPTVHFAGRDHRIDGAGIAPLPVQRPIPIWMGAERDPRSFARVGRLADGWMALGPPSAEASDRLGLIRSAAQSAGRDPGLVGVEAWVNAADGDMVRVAADVQGWRRLGATHVALNSRGPATSTVRQHLEILRRGETVLE